VCAALGIVMLSLLSTAGVVGLEPSMPDESGLQSTLNRHTVLYRE